MVDLGNDGLLISDMAQTIDHEKQLREAAERELTAMAARCGEMREALLTAKHQVLILHPGGDSRNAPKGCGDEVQMSVLNMIDAALKAPLPARAAAMGAVVEKGQVLFDLSNKMEDGISLDSPEWGLAWREFWDACDALAKTEARDG